MPGPFAELLARPVRFFVEAKKPAGKWEKVASEAYGKVTADLNSSEMTEAALVAASAANLHTGKAAVTEGSVVL